MAEERGDMDCFTVLDLFVTTFVLGAFIFISGGGMTLRGE